MKSALVPTDEEKLAALVLLAMVPQDVAGCSDELVAFLQRMVDEIGGFGVLGDAPLP